jgi:hypothetical protein
MTDTICIRTEKDKTIWQPDMLYKLKNPWQCHKVLSLRGFGFPGILALTIPELATGTKQ